MRQLRDHGQRSDIVVQDGALAGAVQDRGPLRVRQVDEEGLVRLHVDVADDLDRDRLGGASRREVDGTGRGDVVHPRGGCTGSGRVLHAGASCSGLVDLEDGRRGAGIALDHLDVGRARRGNIAAQLGKHGRGHVDSDDGTLGADCSRRDQRVHTRSRPHVDDALSPSEPAEGKRVADSGEGFHRQIGQGVDHVGLVAEPGGQGPPGVEMEGAGGSDGHLPVLVPHLCPESLGVDQQILEHRPSPFLSDS